MSCGVTAGGALDAAAKNASNVITSFLERRAGSMCRAIAECFACCAMTRSTGAEDRSGATNGVQVILRYGCSWNYPWSSFLILSSLFSMFSTIRPISLSDGPLLRYLKAESHSSRRVFSAFRRFWRSSLGYVPFT